MDHIIPTSISGKELKRICKKNYTCPFCLVESTKSIVDIKWIETPLVKKKPKYICLGCCIDIYSTCMSTEFMAHPYKDIVEDAAQKVDLDMMVFRKICLEHQKKIIIERIDGKGGTHYNELLKKIDVLLNEYY
jgi:hypothetical protein